ncbi:IclR family transcriptional regulator [Ramlibacter sp. AN1015]|uniref:IclR family transcriptional regulator n=1 Tax=Ramlibacter sp. AN1015 TaxID=3133428 RepID=UPI0030C470A2
MTSSPDAGSLTRGVLLLRLLATAGSRGLALTEIAARSALPHPSAHRVLKQLTAERLVEHHPQSRRYRLGPLTFELGLAGSTMFDIRDLCRHDMATLAASTADTVYLVARSGFDAVCVDRVEGSFPIRTLVLEVGSRRPLGVGAGGLAVLAAIDTDERQEIIERVSPLLPQFAGLDTAALERACEEAQQFGAAVVRGTVNLGVSAVGVAFRDPLGQAVGALSVAAMAQRLPARRMREIARQLQAACRGVEQRLRAHKRGGWQAGSRAEI